MLSRIDLRDIKKEFPEFFKTHPTFNPCGSLKGVMLHLNCFKKRKVLCSSLKLLLLLKDVRCKVFALGWGLEL